MSAPRLSPHASRPGREGLTTQALADLDAAPPAPLTAEQVRDADGTLSRILSATPRADRAPERRRRAGVVPRALLLAAAAAALALVTSVTGVFGGGTAYASWTARPTVLPSPEQADVAQECRDELASGADGTDGAPTADQLRSTDLVLADTRGAYSYVLLSGANGLEATCLIERGRILGLFGWSGSMAGSYGFLTPPSPAEDRIVGTGLMAMGGAGEGSAWSTEGHVGRDVTAVTVVTDGGVEVETTVTSGRFAAWWPDRASIDDSGGLAQVRYIVTLRDGRVLAPQTYDEIAPVAHDE